MKKFLIYVVGAVALFSCEERIEFNNPEMQANKDGVLWRATNYQVDIDNGDLLVRGGFNGEAVWLLPDNDNRGTYVLGDNAISEARFVDENGLEYSTRYAPDPSVQVYPSDGQIIVESFDTVDGRNTVTGTFWFNAFTADGLQKINFNQGVFYRVPFTGGLVVDPIISCDEAVEASATALEAYNATDVMSPEFPALCNAYKTALRNQITSCGDDTNVIQNIIDGLDCSEIVPPDNCQTCTHPTIPTGEYCDNGDGTVDVTVGGSTTTLDLMGINFDDYIAALETGGYTCE
jgi:hypothetical protein